MNIVILENNKYELQNAEKMIKAWATDQDIILNISSYKSGEEYFAHQSTYDANTDLFLLDIQMGEISGIDVAKKLRASGYERDIIFITSFREYIFDGYNVHAFNYLIKPLTQDTLFKCLSEIYKKKEGTNYILHSRDNIIKIPYSNIIAFSANRHSIDITCSDNIYSQYANLNSISEKLPKQFIQVHRSHIVNIEHVLKLSKGKIYLSNGMTINIGPKYVDTFTSLFLQYATRFNRTEGIY